MTTDTLTAHTVTPAVTAMPEVHVFWDEPAVIDQDAVHRDRTQDAYDASVIGAGLIGTVAAFANAYSPYVLLNQALIGLTAALVVAAMLLRWAVAREGRKWVYAVTDEPYYGNPAETP